MLESVYDKPTVTFAPPSDPDQVSAQLIFRVEDEIRAFVRDPDGQLFEISELT